MNNSRRICETLSRLPPSFHPPPGRGGGLCSQLSSLDRSRHRKLIIISLSQSHSLRRRTKRVLLLSLSQTQKILKEKNSLLASAGLLSLEGDPRARASACLLHGAFGRSLGCDVKGPRRQMISHLVHYIPFHCAGKLALAYEANDRHMIVVVFFL